MRGQAHMTYALNADVQGITAKFVAGLITLPQPAARGDRANEQGAPPAGITQRVGISRRPRLAGITLHRATRLYLWRQCHTSASYFCDILGHSGLDQYALLVAPCLLGCPGTRAAGDVASARRHYQAVIDSGHRDHSPDAAELLGELQAEAGNRRGARECFRYAMTNGTADQAAEARALLARLTGQA